MSKFSKVNDILVNRDLDVKANTTLSNVNIQNNLTIAKNIAIELHEELTPHERKILLTKLVICEKESLVKIMAWNYLM